MQPPAIIRRRTQYPDLPARITSLSLKAYSQVIAGNYRRAYILRTWELFYQRVQLFGRTPNPLELTQ